jgi:hypothetical protein
VVVGAGHMGGPNGLVALLKPVAAGSSNSELRQFGAQAGSVETSDAQIAEISADSLISKRRRMQAEVLKASHSVYYCCSQRRLTSRMSLFGFCVPAP